MMHKNKLRELVKQKRLILCKSGEIDTISEKIVNNILNSDIFIKSENIALYYPLKGEVDLRTLLKCNKNFYLPKCIDNELFFAKYDGYLKQGCFSVAEPIGGIINPAILDVIYIPCLCANKRLYRLGYGKGFYDRFFQKYNLHAKKIIVCPKCFITDKFHEDKFDYKCDFIVSDSL